MQPLANIARLIRALLPAPESDESRPFPFVRHGDQSGAELFLDDVMADERGNRHQVFVTRH